MCLFVANIMGCVSSHALPVAGILEGVPSFLDCVSAMALTRGRYPGLCIRSCAHLWQISRPVYTAMCGYLRQISWTVYPVMGSPVTDIMDFESTHVLTCGGYPGLYPGGAL